MEKSPLRVFREKFDLTQQDLADMLDVSRNYITLIENGAKPFSPKMAQKLAAFDACMIPKQPEVDQSKMSKEERIAHLEAALAKEQAKSKKLMEIHRELVNTICPNRNDKAYE